MMWDPALSEHPVSTTNIFAVLQKSWLGSSHKNKVARLCFGATLCLTQQVTLAGTLQMWVRVSPGYLPSGNMDVLLKSYYRLT